MIELQPDLELTTAHAERILAAWLGTPAACSSIARLKGGMVNSVFRLDFDRSPHRAVVKIHASGHDDFAAEAGALAHLADATDCPVPLVHLHDSSGDLVPYSVLLLEHLPGVCLSDAGIGPGDRDDLEVQLAEVLAELHGHQGRRWGRLGDDRAGRSWPEIFAQRLAEVRAYPALEQRLPADVLAVVDDAIAAAGDLLDDDGRPVLVHGDVWDGNLIVRREHGRWRIEGLLDPDLQFADAEMELAYLEVFDNPRETLFTTYARHHPLRPGYERRRHVYWLHTALLHVALFEDDFFRRFAARTAATICNDPTL